MIRIASLMVFLVSACGSSSSNETDQQAALVFFQVYGQLELAQQAALAAQPVAPVVQALDYSAACTDGGTTVVHGTYDGDGSTNATYDLATTFTGCTVNPDTLDGSIHWVASIAGTAQDPVFTETLSGSVVYVGQNYAGTFTFNDITITTTLMNSTATVVVTGSYSIGGTTYTVDKASWAAYFGG